jgi:hypothetical protein
MASEKNQRKAFGFFVDHLESQEPFTRAELHAVTTWSDSAFGTYWSKQFKRFVIAIDDDRYRVSDSFRSYASWKKFQQHVTQVRRPPSREYEETCFENVLVYEFFMPLTNEGHLRTALDALFYRDSIQARLKTIQRNELESAFPRTAGESNVDFENRLCNYISEKFVGYSIYHVNGRFRVLPLANRQDVAKTLKYLVDETTAVTRFIFPCENAQEANCVDFLFTNLFVRAIIEAVSEEDELWMVESGLKNRLHIWRVTNTD